MTSSSIPITSRPDTDMAHLIECEPGSEVDNPTSGEDGNTFAFTACFFSFNQTTTYSPLCHLTLTGDIDKTCCDPTSTSTFNNLWPKSMLRAPRIVINVYVEDSKPVAWRHPRDFFAVYYFLSSSGGFLGGSPSKEQQVKIKFLSRGERMEKMLHENVLAGLDCFLGDVEVEPAGLWTLRHSAP